MKISTIMVRGATIGSTATCGFRTESPRIGRRIAMDIGHMLRHGVGRGSKTNLGDLRHSTMVAGPRCQEVVGDGCPDPCRLPAPSMCDRCMRQRWWRSLEEEQWQHRSNSAAPAELEWRGFLWGRATCGCLLTARAKLTCRGST